MLVSITNDGFDHDGLRYMTEGGFRQGGVSKVKIGIYKDTGDAYSWVQTVSIKVDASRRFLKPETIIRKVAERIRELNEAEID